MRNVALFFIVLFISGTAVNAQPKSPQTINVVLIGGQSNATGQGYMKNIPQNFQIDTTVQIFHSKYLNNGEGSEQWKPLCQASETKNKFGVELSLGTAIQKRFRDQKWVIIKHGLSGSNLYSHWNPGNRSGEKQGLEYVKFVNTVKKGLLELEKQGYKPVIRAMVWQQGEADARDIAGMEISIAYGRNLKNFIEQVRKDVNCEEMLFVLGRVIPLTPARFTGRDEVRNGQFVVTQASQSPLSVKNTFLVEGDDLQMLSTDYLSPYPKDDIHLGTFGLLTLGERFAKTIGDELTKGK